ncbi:hypothetical protein F5X98DRAFT_375516 [Xylaria grammica]|nr:hypothetical protein F5X98DRAFT_375516 [Xylaria grammica]
MLEKLHIRRRLIPLYRETVSESTRHVDQFSCQIEALSATLENDLANGPSRAGLPRIKLEEYQTRIEQLTAVVTAAISIDNSRRSLQDNWNIGRLITLAALFTPLSLVAGIPSMQCNVSDISGDTFKVYFTTSLPLAVVIAAATIFLSLSRSEIREKLMAFKRTVPNLQVHQKSD